MTRARPRICIVRQQDVYELPVRREAEAFRDAGFDVHVILMVGSDGTGSQMVDGVRLHRLRGQRRRGSIGQYLLEYGAFFVVASVKLTRLHLRHRFDVIQVNTMPDFLVFASLLPRLLGARVTVFMKEPAPELATTLYGHGLGARVLRWLLRIAEQRAISYADRAFTVTQELKDAEVARGADETKIHVVLNGPKEANLVDARNPSHGPDTDVFTLLSHGTIEDRYGHDVLLEAVAIARERVPELRLRITGAGTGVPRLLRMVDELDLDSEVEFLGWLSLEDLVAEIASADVGVISLKDSPYSNLVHTNKMYDYVLFDVPVIASRLRSVANYYDGSCIRYFEPDDPHSLAEAITDLHDDADKRQAMVKNARDLYEREYRWTVQQDVLVGATRELIE